MKLLSLFSLSLSCELLQATIEFHSHMKGELSAFAEQVYPVSVSLLIVSGSGSLWAWQIAAPFYCSFNPVFQERMFKWLLEASGILVHAHF
jgi:hypothetical protein